jgi:hypothetical protein
MAQRRRFLSRQTMVVVSALVAALVWGLLAATAQSTGSLSLTGSTSSPSPADSTSAAVDGGSRVTTVVAPSEPTPLPNPTTVSQPAPVSNPVTPLPSAPTSSVTPAPSSDPAPATTPVPIAGPPPDPAATTSTGPLSSTPLGSTSPGPVPSPDPIPSTGVDTPLSRAADQVTGTTQNVTALLPPGGSPPAPPSTPLDPIVQPILGGSPPAPPSTPLDPIRPGAPSAAGPGDPGSDGALGATPSPPQYSPPSVGRYESALVFGGAARSAIELTNRDSVRTSTAAPSGGRPGGNVATALSILASLLSPSPSVAARQIPSPIAPPSPVPLPDSGLGTGSSPSTTFLLGFAALFLLIIWVVPRLICRLDLRSALRRPTPFLSLLEQPG